MKRPEIGRHRQPVEIQHATDAANAFGEPIKTWTTVATVWAEIRGLNSRELLHQDAVKATLTTSLIMRFIPEGAASRPTIGSRIKHGTRYLYVSSVFDPTGDRRELRCLCAENAAI